MKRFSGIPFVWWGTAVLLLAALLRPLWLAELLALPKTKRAMPTSSPGF
ncbi:MAG: hypothetical protein IPL28_05205 [Chloroflexi bacterium]|nr:hypothetical protein [Chloroflexota bacterium]